MSTDKPRRKTATRSATKPMGRSQRPVLPCTTPACRRMKRLFADWHDHRLHWRTRRTLEVHLAVCSPCRCYFESLEQTIVLVREWPGVDVPREVRGHLRALLRERHERRGAAGPPPAGAPRGAGRARRACGR